MNFFKVKLKFFIYFIQLSSITVGASESFTPSCEKVMTVEEFKIAIDNYDYFRKRKKTTKDHPLEKYELRAIEAALNGEAKNYGSVIDSGREINDFNGQTLLVGGGNSKGTYGQNQGKTVLTDIIAEENSINKLIDDLRSDKCKKDYHTGKIFKVEAEKEIYIKALEHKKELYKKAFSFKNKDILERYYTLDIDKDIKPDMIASIISESDVSKIPDNKFMYVEFENVPCEVFLNPKLYKIISRITKPRGKIKLTVKNACRRLIAPVIQNTKFGDQYAKILELNYDLLETLHPSYHRLSFEVINIKD